MVTEIRNFHSLSELSENIEEELCICKTTCDEYGERLGDILRDNQQSHGDEEWFKALSGPQGSSKDKNKGKGKGKGKKKGAGSGWIQFKDLMLSKENHGEAQILFDAIEELKSKGTRLEKLRDDIEDLKRLGLGGDILYISLMREGVPEKIVLHKRGADDERGKFNFTTTVCLTCQTNIEVPSETEDSGATNDAGETNTSDATNTEDATTASETTSQNEVTDSTENANPDETTTPSDTTDSLSQEDIDKLVESTNATEETNQSETAVPTEATTPEEVTDSNETANSTETE